MSVMSPGLDKFLRLWPSDQFHVRIVLLIYIFLVSCTVGRPPKELNSDKSNLNYYSSPVVQQIQPQYVPLFNLVPALPAQLQQSQAVYFSPGFGYFPQYYGGQPHLLQSYYDLPSFQYGSIQPVPQQSFQHVETHSLPEELHSIQSFQYSTTQQQEQKDIPKVKPPIISRNTNATKSRRRKIKNKVNQQLAESRRNAAEKENSVVIPVSEVNSKDASNSDGIKLVDNGSDTTTTEQEQTELNSEDLETEPATNFGIRLPGSSSLQAMRKSRNRTRRRRFLLILSSILARNGGRLIPSQKVSRQVSTENTENDLKNHNLQVPKSETTDDSDEMMEFSEPESSLSAAMAMKYGMNLISSTIPAPEPTTPAKPVVQAPKKRNTGTTIRLKPSEVDYEVSNDDSELINDLPPRPIYTDTPVTQSSVAMTSSNSQVINSNNNNTLVTTPPVSVEDSRSEVSAKSTGEDYDLSDLPPLPAIDQDDSFAPVIPEAPEQVIPEENSNESPSFDVPTEGIGADQMSGETERQPETAAAPQQIPQTNPGSSEFEEVNSDLPPLPGSLVPVGEGDSFASSPEPDRPSSTTTTSEVSDSDFDGDLFEDSVSPDLPPIQDISLFPSTAEQDEPAPPPFRPSLPTQTPRPTTTTEPPRNINIPIFNDNVPPFPVTDDGSLPELPFPAALPEDTDLDQYQTEQEEPAFVQPITPAPTERPRPVANPRIPVAPPRIPTRPNPTGRPRVVSTSTEVPVESEYIPTGNNDWLRDVALKALDRGISFQQVYSINVGHVVINSGGSTSEFQNITPKPLYQLIQEQLVPAISSFVQSQTRPNQIRPNRPNSGGANRRPGTRRPVAAGPNVAIANEGTFADPDDIGTDFAPIPLATEAEGDAGVSEQELFSTRLNTTKSPTRRRPPSSRPLRPNMGVKPTVNKGTVVANRDEVNQSEVQNQQFPESSGNGVTSSSTRPFRPLPEDAPSPRIKQNIDPRSLNSDSFPFHFPEGSAQDDFPLDLRSALVKSMQNYRSRTRTAN